MTMRGSRQKHGWHTRGRWFGSHPLGLRCSGAGPYLLMGNLIVGIGATPHSMFGSYGVATKKRPQEAHPEAVSDQECGLPWSPLMSRKAATPRIRILPPKWFSPQPPPGLVVGKSV